MRFNIQAQTPTKACKRRKAKRVIPHGPPTASRQPPTNRAQPELYGQLQCLLPFLTNTLSLRIFSLSISLYLSLSRSTPLHLSLSLHFPSPSPPLASRESITVAMAAAPAVLAQKPEGLGLYSRFAFAGAVCCSVTHGAFTPVDVYVIPQFQIHERVFECS